MSRFVVASLVSLVALTGLTLYPGGAQAERAAPPAQSSATQRAEASQQTAADPGIGALVAAFAGGAACAGVVSWLTVQARRRRARRTTATPGAATAAGADTGGEWQMLDGDEAELVALHDAHGVVRYVSSALLELTGFRRHEIVGHQGRDFVHPDDLPTLLATVQAARADVQSPPLLFRLRDSSGGYAWIEAEFRHSVSRTGEPEMLSIARSVARSATPVQTWGAAGKRSAAPEQVQLAAWPSTNRKPSRAAAPALEEPQGPSLQDLCHAFERREFELHYQLKVGLSNWEVTGVEALLRWNVPEGSGRTAEIIAAAERTGFIVTLGEWVLRAAANQSLQWRRTGLRYPVSVNVSRIQLLDRRFVDLMRELVARDRELPLWLELELTENALAHVGDIDRSVHAIAQLVALGFTLHVDDFGAGYSKLKQLSRMPLRALKIDRSIVHDLTVPGSAGEVVGAVVSLSRALGVKVIAEGVETTEQLERLRAHGCDEVQGYLFSQPMSADAVRALTLPENAAAGGMVASRRGFEPLYRP